MSGMTLQEWLISTQTGNTILELEKKWINQILAKWFGSYLLHIGEVGAGQFWENSRISRHALITSNIIKQTDICATFDELPFASESVDCVILPHVLETVSEPLNVLKEIERILIADGHLIVLGFNPYSASGVWRMAGAWRTMQSAPPRFYSQRQLQLWLLDLGFEIVGNYHGFCRPPIDNSTWFQKLQWMERLSFISSIYGLAIQKRRLIIPTPLLRRERKPRWANVPEPTVLRHDNDPTR